MLLGLLLLPFKLVIGLVKLIVGLIAFIIKTIFSIFIVPILLIAGIATVIMVIL